MSKVRHIPNLQLVLVSMSREFWIAACVWHDAYSQAFMGWLRLVGSLKLKVSFAKEPFTGDSILQKRPRTLCPYSCEYESCHRVLKAACVWHNSSIHVTCLIHLCRTTHSSMSHDSSIYVVCLIHVRETTHSHEHEFSKKAACVWHDSFIYICRSLSTKEPYD